MLSQIGVQTLEAVMATQRARESTLVGNPINPDWKVTQNFWLQEPSHFTGEEQKGLVNYLFHVT